MILGWIAAAQVVFANVFIMTYERNGMYKTGHDIFTISAVSDDDCVLSGIEVNKPVAGFAGLDPAISLLNVEGTVNVFTGVNDF